MNRYFLFGGVACKCIDENRIRDISKDVYGLYVWKHDSDPANLLKQAMGWDDYLEIDYEQYVMIKTLRK
jgi:hypothetical protein